jgi:antitoxin component of MazEF toxin-antitoxin module
VWYLRDVKAVRAHVQNGKVILDEAVDLVDGTDVEVLVPNDHEMSAEDQAEFDEALAESTEQFARGEFEEARSFALRLLAKS